MKRGKKVILILVFLVGLGIFAYPSISDCWNDYRNSKLISEYTKSLESLSVSEKNECMEAALEYNQEHHTNIIYDPLSVQNEAYKSEKYRSRLNLAGDGIMGYITIPKISVCLPIYHGIEAETLEHGCGHLSGTSLPVGGANTHCVLSAHRGLPRARLFSDLDQMEKGDVFEISVLDSSLFYKVDKIETVLPSEISSLKIYPQEDLVTLVTCTPYGVNSHRLLVRGSRYEPIKGKAEFDELEISARAITPKSHIRIWIVAGIGLLLIIFLAYDFVKKRKED